MVSGGIGPPFLTSTLDEDEWSVSRPERFTPGERALSQWLGGLQCRSGRC
jgi:hypothetical protein